MRYPTHGQAMMSALAALLVWLVPTEAAEKAAPAPQSLNVTVIGIHAKKEPKPFIDPALKAIAAELGKRAVGYNTFRLLVSKTSTVALGKTWECPMTENYARQVEPITVEADKATVRLRWIQYVVKQKTRKAQEREKLTLSIRKGKYFLSGGWKLKEGVLLGAVAVQ
jgi:hypothetical protein